MVGQNGLTAGVYAGVVAGWVRVGSGEGMCEGAAGSERRAEVAIAAATGVVGAERCAPLTDVVANAEVGARCLAGTVLMRLLAPHPAVTATATPAAATRHNITF